MSDYPLGADGLRELRAADVEWLRYLHLQIEQVLAEKHAERGGQGRGEIVGRILEAHPSENFVLLVDGGGGICALTTEGRGALERAVVTWANHLLYGETAPLEIHEGRVRLRDKAPVSP